MADTIKSISDLLTLMADNENPGTIIDIVNLFTDEEYQMEKVAKLTNPTVKSWWIKVFGSMGAREKEEMIPYFAAKFGQFITNVTVRNTLGQSKSSFSIRQIMDEGKILIANLSKGKLGEVNSSLIGTILTEEIRLSQSRKSKKTAKYCLSYTSCLVSLLITIH